MHQVGYNITADKFESETILYEYNKQCNTSETAYTIFKTIILNTNKLIKTLKITTIFTTKITLYIKLIN